MTFKTNNRFSGRGGFVGAIVLVSLGIACAGGIPSVPDRPESILAKADQFFDRGKYLQATELYKAFLERHTGHGRSDYAQFKLAESYFNDGQFALAAVEYQVLMSNYGYSEYVDDALFRIGVCYCNESPKPERDQQKSEDALSRFRQFLQTFPTSPLADDVRDYVDKVHLKLAEKEFRNGRYYFRRGKNRAALIYFDKIIEKHPGNPFWVRAVYYKALILEARGDRDEAARHLAQVVAWPGNVDVKADARERLKSLGR